MADCTENRRELIAATNDAVAPKTYAEILAANADVVLNPESRLRLAAAATPVGANPGTVIPAASAAPSPECRHKLVAANAAPNLDPVIRRKLDAVAATTAQATAKIEGHYLEFAKKLFEPLEDAKRCFAMEKVEVTERLHKEKDEIIERLLKEKDAIIERLQKEKDEVTERLQKEKDEVTERLHKEKDEIIERMNAEVHYPSKRGRAQ